MGFECLEALHIALARALITRSGLWSSRLQDIYIYIIIIYTYILIIYITTIYIYTHS